MINDEKQLDQIDINPTVGFEEYVKVVKPYHSKILEVEIEYTHNNSINTKIIETFNYAIA